MDNLIHVRVDPSKVVVEAPPEIRFKSLGQLIDEMTIMSIRVDKYPDYPPYICLLEQYRRVVQYPERIEADVARLRETNLQIWELINKVMADEHTRGDAVRIQQLNQTRTQIIRYIDVVMCRPILTVMEKMYR